MRGPPGAGSARRSAPPAPAAAAAPGARSGGTGGSPGRARRSGGCRRAAGATIIAPVSAPGACRICARRSSAARPSAPSPRAIDFGRPAALVADALRRRASASARRRRRGRSSRRRRPRATAGRRRIASEGRSRRARRRGAPGGRRASAVPAAGLAEPPRPPAAARSRGAQRDGDGLRAGRCAQLRHRIADVGAHGLGGEHQALGDLGAAQPVCEQLEDLALAVRERAGAGPPRTRLRRVGFVACATPSFKSHYPSPRLPVTALRYSGPGIR